MEIILYLLEKFYNEEKITTFLLLLATFSINIFQINGISFISAKILEGIENSRYPEVFYNYKLFIGLSIFAIILYHIYRLLQNKLLTKLKNWVRQEILRLILAANNESLDQINFMELSAPTQRTGAACYLVFNSFFSELLPNFSFLLMISLYFFYKNFMFGFVFLLANLLIVYYFYLHWNELMTSKKDYEAAYSKNETDLLDIFNNMEKIIYRGETNNEIDKFTEKTSITINKTLDYANLANSHVLYMISYSHIILFSSMFYMLLLRKSNKLDKTMFISFFTILLLYRDRAGSTIQSIPDYIDYIGRADYVMYVFNSMISRVKTRSITTYKNVELPFNIIKFENVSFKYKASDKPLFENLNITLHTNNKIIGITGLSGNGKSTFTKMMLKLYEYDNGEIYIDNVNIKELDNYYIRKNITYVNQNSKLFDKKVIENILYACNNPDTCNNHLNEILNYPKIAQLYRNIDLHNKQSGSLGENLSGGQRQIINIISGLINPSKILILDEPTNALDPELKKELLGLIKDFKKHRKCIMIITHDKDVYPLFDETIHI